MTVEEELQTIEEHVHTMVALAHRLRERMGRKATVDKEVQTMATSFEPEQPLTAVLLGWCSTGQRASGQRLGNVCSSN